MHRRNIFRTCFYAFGAGVGFGAGMAIKMSIPKASEMVVLILEKLGFELNDILLYIFDPNDTYQVHKPARKKRKTAARATKKVPALTTSRRTRQAVA